jgi:osmotically-inducible protein OsmY
MSPPSLDRAPRALQVAHNGCAPVRSLTAINASHRKRWQCEQRARLPVIWEEKFMSTEASSTGSIETESPWRLDAETTEMAVTIVDGDVALTGRVRCRMRQSQRGEAASCAPEDDEEVLEVLVPLEFKRSDIQLARGVAAALRLALPSSCEHARLTIEDGRVTLDGELQWTYQRERIEGALATVAGVVSVSDRTSISPRVNLARIGDLLEQALRSGADGGANRSSAADAGTAPSLRSWALRDHAER